MARTRAALEKAQAELTKPGETEAGWQEASFRADSATVRLQTAAKGGVSGAAEG